MRWAAIASSLIIAWGILGTAVAADDSKSSREREMLRRAQEALRQSQSDNSNLAASKADAEAKLKAASSELEALRGKGRAEASGIKAKLQAAAESQAALTSQLEAARQQIAALNSKEKELTAQLATRDSTLKQAQTDLEASRATGASCEAKNLKLYQYSRELADRYQKKGVWASMRQKEPVLGLGEVKMENVLQEYKEKLDSQRIR